ncbi:hypothetical protein BKA56DRAFT_689415 [Ilyonectria sp. MPI-CAGE-AT-0026]|nr:hypothetical protein BKA56DRAFT_689415 [Ilyonectria sp. MPI-CAGE-AT-0026]
MAGCRCVLGTLATRRAVEISAWNRGRDRPPPAVCDCGVIKRLSSIVGANESLPLRATPAIIFIFFPLQTAPITRTRIILLLVTTAAFIAYQRAAAFFPRLDIPRKPFSSSGYHTNGVKHQGLPSSRSAILINQHNPYHQHVDTVHQIRSRLRAEVTTLPYFPSHGSIPPPIFTFSVCELELNVQDNPTVPRGTTNELFAYATAYEPVNARMQNPSYIAGTPLFSRDPHAERVVTALTLTTQTSASQAAGSFNNFAGLGVQSSAKQHNTEVTVVDLEAMENQVK